MNENRLAIRLSKFDYDTGVLLQNVAVGCIGLTPGVNLPMLILRSPSVSILLYSGFIDETFGNYVNVRRACSKAKISAALVSCGFDAPEKMFSRNGRWNSILAYIQNLYNSHPDEVKRLFAVVDGSVFTYRNASRIDRILTRQLWY